MPNPNSPQTDEAAGLRAENQRLREELADARANAKVLPNTKPRPTEPSFGLSEGQRADLEMSGKTVSPFTGARQVGSGEPGVKPQVVSADEYDKR